MKRTAFFGLIVAATSAHAEIDYRVQVMPRSGKLHVTMSIPATQNGARLQIPNWSPGAYILRDGFKDVQDLKAYDQNRNALTIQTKLETIDRPYVVGTEKKVAKNSICTWMVSPAEVTTVEYDVPARYVAGVVHYSGPSTYLYEVSRKNETCRLSLKTPTGWPVAVGLDEVAPGSQEFTAKTYDVLADNPVSTGDLKILRYESRGKEHVIAMRGVAKDKVDADRLIRECKLVTDAETSFFGGQAPYSKYVWHFDVNEAPDGAGGLEHLSSTQISLSSGVGPRAVSVLAHEFFHLWNVKRIRSRVLGPFDYTRLPETGALWWLEGVTDYYASTLLHRYGRTDDDSYLASAASNLTTVRRNPAYLQIGPNESSLRVAEASNGRGNSNGYLISYYNEGWLAGMVLDLAIRAETDNKRSLDDVEKALWAICRDDKPGFAEDEIRKQVMRVGGKALAPLYDRVVLKGGDMAIEETLARAGLQVVVSKEEFAELGFQWAGGPGQTALVVGSVGPSATGVLQENDVLLEVNGRSLVGLTGRAAITAVGAATRGIKIGTPISIKVRRGTAELNVGVTPVAGSRPLLKIQRSSTATEAQKKIADAWLATAILIK